MNIAPSVAVDAIQQGSMPTSNGKTLYVGGSGGGNYTRIQYAINDASDGDTVFVYDDSSPYYENVKVDKSINLIGEDKNTTVINPIESYSSVVYIFSSTDNVLISGFTITGGDAGIYINGNNNTVRGNKIFFNQYGIEIDRYSNNNVITENIIVHNRYVGIWDDCRDSYNTVTWNVINGNGHPELGDGGIYKQLPGGIFHHNDFDLNWGYNAYTSWSSWGIWDDGSEGNYWDNWESNPGYPNVYIIKGSEEDQIDNHPSATPYFDYPIVRIPKSSYIAYPNETIHFRSYVNKPISSLSILWDFGDGNTSNGKNPDYSYSESGIYHINVTITDDKGVSDTDRSIAFIGFPPDNPVITGPKKGTIGTQYNYSIVSNDSDSDYLHYIIGEDLFEKEIGPYPSGEVVEIIAWWYEVGNHTFYVKAIDDTLLESEWTYFTTYIPRNRAPTYSLFQLIFNRFPLLEVFLRAMNLLR